MYGGNNLLGDHNLPPKSNNFFTYDLVVEEGIVHARIRNDRPHPLSILAGMKFDILVYDGVSLEVELDKLALDALRVRCPLRDDSLSAPMFSEDTDRTGAVLSSSTSSGGSVCPTPINNRTTWGRSTTAGLGPEPQPSVPTKPSPPQLSDSTMGAKQKAPIEPTKPNKRHCGDSIYHKVTENRPDLDDKLKRALWQYELGSSNHFSLPKLLALHIKLTEDLELEKPKICLNQKVYEEQAHEIALCHLLCDRNAADLKNDLTITEIDYVNQDAKTGPLDASKLSKSEKELLLKAIDVAEFATNGDIDPTKLPARPS